ncbi:MAG: hypothetical protein NWT02_04570 [Opitutales bacterium]|jgi:hypothetical protein|nr:hypothetical protein [Opitutales bacterium]MDP4644118.1 hypothetical protein [Opitutales bacterium]MDP4778584.1 hypothetical protein [Opitutales bacterium]MDP4883808.1 hypothetical protein [Opitutales bacterium]MDP5080865.1 hypothetical protein [Opitutales bacterium]
MDKIKSLLLPLALVFAAIAVFETGARYGASNMRAHAIAGELVFPLTVYVQGKDSMNAESRANIAAVIDNGIAAGSMHRQLWYLQKDSKDALDKVLAYAFSVRGDGVLERLTQAQAEEGINSDKKARLAEVTEAIKQAKADLADSAKDAADKKAAELAEPAAE